MSLVVREYDEAIAFYVGVLGFALVEDSFVPEQNKRWVVVAPPGSTGARLLLARAANPEQAARIGSQTGVACPCFSTLTTLHATTEPTSPRCRVRSRAKGSALRKSRRIPRPLR